MADPVVLAAALRRLAAHDLDLYLEQRLEFRRLVAMGSHAYRGVAPPKPSTHYATLLERGRTAPSRKPARQIGHGSVPSGLRRIVRPGGEVLNVY